MVTRSVILLSVLGLAADAQDYVLCIQASDSAHRAFTNQVPPGIRVVDVTHWRDVPAEIRAINPAHYPALIDLDSGAVVERPTSWSDAMARLEQRREQKARKSRGGKSVADLRKEIESAKSPKEAVLLLYDLIFNEDNNHREEQ